MPLGHVPDGYHRSRFAYSNEEGEAVGLSTADIYADLAKPLAERTLHCEHVPVRPQGPNLYTLWDLRQSS